MTVLSDSSWIDFSYLTNSGHGGFAIKIFGFAVRSSVLHLSRRDLVSRFQPVSSSAATTVLRPSCTQRSLKRAGEYTSVRSAAHFSKQVFTRPCTDSLHLPGNAFDVNTRFCQFLKVSGVAFIEAKRSNCTRAGRLDSNTRRKRNTGLYHVVNTHACSHRRIDRNVSTRARATLNWSRATLNRNCLRDSFLQVWERLRALTLLTPPRLQLGLRLGLRFQYVLYIVCLSSFCPQSGVANEYVLHCRLQRPINVSPTQIRHVPPPAFLHLVVLEVRDRSLFLLRLVPGSLQSRDPRLVYVCELANVHDLQVSLHEMWKRQ